MARTTSRPATTQTQPQRNIQTATATITSRAAVLQGLIQNVADLEASSLRAIPLQASEVVPVPIQSEWGLPGHDQIQPVGINSWIFQVRNVFVGGHSGVLADSCVSMADNAQLLCMATMDLMRASLNTYKTSNF